MKTFHHIYIYRDRETPLPEDGWFQACFVCYTITARLSFFDCIEKKDNIYKIMVHLCSECTRQLKTDKEFKDRYTLRCQRYLKRNFPETLKTLTLL